MLEGIKLLMETYYYEFGNYNPIYYDLDELNEIDKEFELRTEIDLCPIDLVLCNKSEIGSYFMFLDGIIKDLYE